MATLSRATRGLLPLMAIQTKLFLREPVAAFFTIAFAPALLMLFGTIYGNDPDEVFGGRGSMDVAVPGYVGIVIVTVALIGIPTQMATSRELGVLRRYHVTPLLPLTYVVADVAAYYLMTLTGTILLVVVGALAFDVRVEGNVAVLVAGFTLCAFAFFSVGYLLGSLAPSARVAQTVGMVVAYPMMFLSGATVPLEILSPGLRQVADFIPLTHVVNLMRGLWFGDPWADIGLSVGVLAGILVLATGLSARFFRWQ